MFSKLFKSSKSYKKSHFLANFSTFNASSLANRNILVSNSLGTSNFPPLAQEYLENGGAKLSFLDLETNREQRYKNMISHLESFNGNPPYDGLYITLEDTIDEKILNLLSNNKNFRVVSTLSVGTNHIHIPTCKANNIEVGYTPDILTNTTADLVLALTLATCRRITEASLAARDGEWGVWNPLWMCGKDLYRSTVGIIGMGAIGLAVARRLLGFGCQILYCNHSGKEKAEARDLGLEYTDLNKVLRNSDIVIPMCPLTNETRGLLSYEKFEIMKSDSILINASRGDVVNQNDLIRALDNEEIAAAGLDVTTPEPLELDNPLFSMKNVVVLPHIGSASVETRNEMAIQACKNMESAFTQENSRFLLKM